MLLTEKGFLVAAPGLTAACMTREEGHVAARICAYERRQRQNWGIEREKETNVFARGGGTAQCLTTEDGGRLEMSPCRLDKNRAQMWTWEFERNFRQKKEVGKGIGRQIGLRCGGERGC